MSDEAQRPDKIISLVPKVEPEHGTDLVTALRALADEIESGKTDFMPESAFIILHSEDDPKLGGNGDTFAIMRRQINMNRMEAVAIATVAIRDTINELD